jgi:hypothetical protein
MSPSLQPPKCWASAADQYGPVRTSAIAQIPGSSMMANALLHTIMPLRAVTISQEQTCPQGFTDGDKFVDLEMHATFLHLNNRKHPGGCSPNSLNKIELEQQIL